MVRIRKVGREPEVSTSVRIYSLRVGGIDITPPYRRAGIVPGTPAFESLLKAIYTSWAISLHGFYCHAGDSYGSTGLSQASHFLSSEVQTANEAAKLATDLISGWSDGKGEHPKFVLSVGSTPTAHSASAKTRAQLGSLLHGTLELHAGKHAVTCGCAHGVLTRS